MRIFIISASISFFVSKIFSFEQNFFFCYLNAHHLVCAIFHKGFSVAATQVILPFVRDNINRKKSIKPKKNQVTSLKYLAFVLLYTFYVSHTRSKCLLYRMNVCVYVYNKLKSIGVPNKFPKPTVFRFEKCQNVKLM